MSFHTNIASLVCTLKDTLLPRGGYDTTVRALAVKLDLRMSHYFDDGESNASRMVFFMFYGNTSVWMAVEESDDRWFNASNIPIDRWSNTSNHDSCWRVDGVSTPLFNLYCEMSDQVKAGVPDGDKLAPINIDQHCNLGFCGSNPWEFVTVTTEQKDRNVGNSSWTDTVLVDISSMNEE